MNFEEILDYAMTMLQRRGRVSYRTLRLQFHLNDESLEALKEELIEVHHLAVDQDGRRLVWVGAVSPTPIPSSSHPPQEPIPQADQPSQVASPSASPPLPDAERRQLTVLFCDLVDSTALANRLDPEDLREIVRAYQATCAEIIQRFAGHIAQYLGDGLLVYFGYPQAHEDDAQRAVRSGLGIVEALDTLNSRLGQGKDVRLAVRVGIHTGLVVVGDMGGDGRQEQLALGDTPNIAARIQGLAAPNTVLISAATQRLIQGYFTCHALGGQTLKGVATPLEVHQVVGATAVRQRFDIAVTRGLTPLVGREYEVELLRDRWAQVQAGQGHIVVLSGEAGIGKSRLVQTLQEHIAGEAYTRLEGRCSPYTQQSALSPVIEQIQRWLQWHQDDTPEVKLHKLEEALETAGFVLAEVVPLFAALCSLPLPERYPPLDLTPQRYKQQTLAAVLAWLLKEAERQPVCLVLEDLHWVDPSTLELLNLLIDQVPLARLLVILTCRPEFIPPRAVRSHVTHVVLGRLTPRQTEQMLERVTGGKALPAEVQAQLLEKTNGVPLFVEELTKMVLESGLVKEKTGHYELAGPLPPLAIPTTLQDSLMARLDQQGLSKPVAQLGATLGREFSYEVLQAVSPLDEVTLQQGLEQLVHAEILYQRGLPPQAQYVFKHVLIQEAAYQSLLRSTRQQYHRQIAQVLEERFPETCASQPELVAHHYTGAGLRAQAVVYWQRAGERALQRSANLEAISHLRRGLEVLTTLPEIQERARQELGLQIALGLALTAAMGYAAPEVETAYARAYELGQHVEDAPQLPPVLWGRWFFAMGRAEYGRAEALGEHILHMGQRVQDPLLLLTGHTATGTTLLFQGALVRARRHLEQSVSLYDPQQHHVLAFLYGMDYGMVGRAWLGWQRLAQGYPSQGLQHSEEALRLAQEVAHPYNLASILLDVIVAQLWRREVQRTQKQAEVLIALANEHGFTLRVAQGALLHSWALVMQGKINGGLPQMRQAVSAIRATGVALGQSFFLGMFAEACGQAGQIEEGLDVLDEAQAHVDTTGERWWEAELHRLKGELLLQSGVQSLESGVLTLDTGLKTLDAEAETCFQQALTVARGQEAKWLELRAAMSLSRLWQQQGKRAQGYELLAPIYNWFTEGFDTSDLQDAKVLLEELS